MPNATDLFFYVAAFVTVVLGLAVGDMVTSTHRLLRARERVRWSTLAAMAALFVFLCVLIQFFTLWELLGRERFYFVDLVVAMLSPTLISIAALSVLPDDVPDEGVDLKVFYLDNRRYLYGILTVTFAVDVVQHLFALDRNAADWVEDVVILTIGYALTLAIFAVLFRSASPRVHGIALAILLGLATAENALWDVGVTRLPA